MLPTNHNERKRNLSRFGLYYGLSIAAVCIVVFAFADSLRGAQTTSVVPAENRIAQSVFAADSLLHRQFSLLEDLDNRYNYAMSVSKTRDGMRAADSLRRLVPAAEQDFRFTLDSISKRSRGESGVAWEQTVDFFATALALRSKRLTLPLNNAGAAATAMPAPAAMQAAGSSILMTPEELIKSNPALKEQILKRDIRIADLEATVSQLKKNSPGKSMSSESPSAMAGTAGTAASRQLQQDYEALQKSYKSLAESNARLRNAPEQPSAKTAETEAVKTANARSEKMEQQLQEINADLSFSTVDCNLSRADVNQIIYNGKQRKVLLQQALDILTALKKSGDEQIQKRAMQKIGQLNRIAMTVRD